VVRAGAYEREHRNAAGPRRGSNMSSRASLVEEEGRHGESCSDQIARQFARRVCAGQAAEMMPPGQVNPERTSLIARYFRPLCDRHRLRSNLATMRPS